MKTVVIGADSFCGQYIFGFCNTISSAFGTSFVNSKSGVFSRIDIRSRPELHKYLSQINPNIIIHTAGLSDIDFCESNPLSSHETSVNGTQNIVDWCISNRCRLIYISTDYIFDGVNGNYDELATPSPVNVYPLCLY